MPFGSAAKFGDEDALFFDINLASHTDPNTFIHWNHSVPPFTQRHVFDLGAISPGLKLSGPFIWAETWGGWTRIGVWKQVFWPFDVSPRWSSRFGSVELPWPCSGDWQCPPLHTHPSQWTNQVPKIHPAVLNKTSDTLTPWLMVRQKEPP